MSLVSDPRADNQSGANPSESAPKPTSKKNWIPTAEAFDQLLTLLSPDRDEAGKEYEKLRTKLIRFFEWRGCGSADTLADRTFDLVMRKISEGEEITNVKGFIHTVAVYKFLEDLDRYRLVPISDAFSIPAPDPLTLEPEDDRLLLSCFDKCLNELPPESRKLIMTYYQEEKRTKIDLRRQLADELGIPMNALRIRAHRIRRTLEERIQKCLAH